jgi:hypothetical protein
MNTLGKLTLTVVLMVLASPREAAAGPLRDRLRGRAAVPARPIAPPVYRPAPVVSAYSPPPATRPVTLTQSSPSTQPPLTQQCPGGVCPLKK